MLVPDHKSYKDACNNWLWSPVWSGSTEDYDDNSRKRSGDVL